ncbi:unnamed protein product, partial [Prorocentrum cordatum]
MIRWATGNQRNWDCTSYEKAAGGAAWDVLSSHEMGDPGDQSELLEATITAVLDLVKAFEKVCLHVLWEAGRQLNFNTGVLAAVCSYFAMARGLVVGDAVSSETRTVKAIIAGSKFSARFLKMVIQSTVDGLVVDTPRVTWRMYVDGRCVRLGQQQQRIVQELSDEIDACFQGFGKLGPKLSVGSQGKGAVMASTKWERKAVAKDMEKGGLPVVRACPCLGVDLVARGTAAKSKSGKKHKGEHLQRGNVEGMMMKAWKRQQQEVGMNPMWAKVRGPAGAVIMSLRRAGWAWPARCTVISQDGRELDMREACPMDVAALLKKDVQQQLWEAWTKAEERESLRPALLAAPAVAQLRARDSPKHAKNAAEKAFVSGSWTMSKLCQCNIAPTDICMACGESGGTPHHRYYKCPGIRELRLKAQPEWQTAAEQQEDNLPWTRGLVQHPEADWKFVGIDEGQYMHQAVEGDEDYIPGDIACDGSKPGYSDWAQTGWAAMSIDEEGKPRCQMWGPLPYNLPVHRRVKRAEMRVFCK